MTKSVETHNASTSPEEYFSLLEKLSSGEMADIKSLREKMPPSFDFVGFCVVLKNTNTLLKKDDFLREAKTMLGEILSGGGKYADFPLEYALAFFLEEESIPENFFSDKNFCRSLLQKRDHPSFRDLLNDDDDIFRAADSLLSPSSSEHITRFFEVVGSEFFLADENENSIRRLVKQHSSSFFDFFSTHFAAYQKVGKKLLKRFSENSFDCLQKARDFWEEPLEGKKINRVDALFPDHHLKKSLFFQVFPKNENNILQENLFCFSDLSSQQQKTFVDFLVSDHKNAVYFIWRLRDISDDNAEKRLFFQKAHEYYLSRFAFDRREHSFFYTQKNGAILSTNLLLTEAHNFCRRQPEGIQQTTASRANTFVSDKAERICEATSDVAKRGFEKISEIDGWRESLKKRGNNIVSTVKSIRNALFFLFQNTSKALLLSLAFTAGHDGGRATINYAAENFDIGRSLSRPDSEDISETIPKFISDFTPFFKKEVYRKQEWLRSVQKDTNTEDVNEVFKTLEDYQSEGYSPAKKDHLIPQSRTALDGYYFLQKGSSLNFVLLREGQKPIELPHHDYVEKNEGILFISTKREDNAPYLFLTSTGRIVEDNGEQFFSEIKFSKEDPHDLWLQTVNGKWKKEVIISNFQMDLQEWISYKARKIASLSKNQQHILKEVLKIKEQSEKLLCDSKFQTAYASFLKLDAWQTKNIDFRLNNLKERNPQNPKQIMDAIDGARDLEKIINNYQTRISSFQRKVSFQEKCSTEEKKSALLVSSTSSPR